MRQLKKRALIQFFILACKVYTLKLTSELKEATLKLNEFFNSYRYVILKHQNSFLIPWFTLINEKGGGGGGGGAEGGLKN